MAFEIPGLTGDGPEVIERWQEPDAPRSAGHKQATVRARRSVTTLVLLLLAGATLAPIAVAIVASFQGGPTSSGGGFTTHTWTTLFSTLPLRSGLENSAILAVGATLVVLLIAPAAGFAFAKLKFPGSQIVLYLTIGTMMVPIVSVVVPEFVNVAHLHLINSYAATVGVYAGFNVGLSVFLFTVYFRNVPNGLLEAALLDGASYWQAYRRIFLPMSRPALVTGGVLSFINIWNDFLVALLFMPGGGRETVNVVLATVNGQHVVETNLLIAGSLVAIAPTVLVYILFQRYLVAGFAMTAAR